MADDIKITGGNTSSELLSIPRGELFPIQFKPEFAKDYPKAERQVYLQDRLRLFIYNIPVLEEDKPDHILEPFIAGEEVLYNLDPDQIVAGERPDLFLGKIVRVVKGTNRPLETLSEFAFRVTKQIAAPDIGRHASPAIESANGGQAGSSFRNTNNPVADLTIALSPTDRVPENDAVLWDEIKELANKVSFNAYEEFIDDICSNGLSQGDHALASRSTTDNINETIENLASKRFLPFIDTDSYHTIKVLTEAFLLANCSLDANQAIFENYTKPIDPQDTSPESPKTYPYLLRIRKKLRDIRIKPKSIGDILELFYDPNGYGTINRTADEDCYGIMQRSLTQPCFIELIWSYWHEESMLVQALNMINRRFQNVRSPGSGPDPLAGMEIAPLRPLNNLLWGYIQDEQHRLSIKRRAYEYDHHYGFSLVGKAVPNLRTADSRANFIEAFHSLLHRTVKFYKEEDNTMVVADGFPVLNALREVHLLLTQGMHNQYGDLPFTARVEMMMQQWIMARPEFREFLPTRTMVAYPEAWMDRVGAMNQLQNWTNVSPLHYSNLGRYGESLLLSIRFGDWHDPNLTGNNAAGWANAFRNEIQGYIHAYRAVAGVDLSIPNPQTGKIDSRPPSLHLQNRLMAQQRGKAPVK